VFGMIVFAENAGGYWLDALDIGNDRKTLWPFHILRACTFGVL
jgi:hypothetical protein